MRKPSAYKHAIRIAVFVGASIVIPAVSDTVAVAEDEEGSRRLDRPQVFPSLDVEVAFPNLPGLPDLVHLTHAGDGSNRIFGVSQPGRIYVFENAPDVSSAEVFLDIEERVNSLGLEQGLLGLAFPPDHAKSGHFFVYYTRVGLTDTRLSRFSTGAGANQADPNSELVIMDIEQPFDNHNGGMLIFGPDGMLYVSLGDGGPQGDPFGNGQNPATLLGSVLRISVNSSTPQIPYEIPPDNPFFGSPGQEREEIWAYGLRNPWKLAFDPNTNDRGGLVCLNSAARFDKWNRAAVR